MIRPPRQTLVEIDADLSHKHRQQLIMATPRAVVAPSLVSLLAMSASVVPYLESLPPLQQLRIGRPPLTKSLRRTEARAGPAITLYSTVLTLMSVIGFRPYHFGSSNLATGNYTAYRLNSTTSPADRRPLAATTRTNGPTSPTVFRYRPSCWSRTDFTSVF